VSRSWLLSRRTFLRGSGAALGLPILDAMGPVVGRASAEAAAGATPGAVRPPVRMACMYFPNGVWEKTWHPKEPGRDYAMTFALEPLGPLRKEVLVFSGLDKKHSHAGDGHYAKTANFLTGLPVHRTTGKQLSVGGASIDQVAAQKIGRLTPLPSMELGIDPVISGIDTNVGYTRLYGSYISWRSASQPVAREIQPKSAYQRLYLANEGAKRSKPEDRRRAEDRRLLLDLVLDDARYLRNRLGRDDQFKLDEYLDAVRDVEKRLDFFSSPDPRAWRPPTRPDEAQTAAPAGEPGDHREHVRLMLDLLVLAFWTDATRVGTFMFANDVSGKNFGALIPGASGAHHEFSHHQDKKELYEPYSKINRWHVEQLAYMLGKMAAIREGEGTILDNSMILFGSSISDGNSHKPSNIPVLLAGRGDGTIDSGRHIACPDGTPLCNLYVAMLERMGCPVHSFGDSTAALPIG
jgi:hypothetical protein